MRDELLEDLSEEEEDVCFVQDSIMMRFCALVERCFRNVSKVLGGMDLTSMRSD